MQAQNWEILALIFLLIVAAIVWRLRGKAKFIAPVTQHMPVQDAKDYALAPSIFVNPAERAFYSALCRALQNASTRHVLVLTKVRLEDVIGVASHVKDGKRRWQLRGRVKSRHVDYLICASDGRPLMAIELDGNSHASKRAVPSDALKDAIFAACALELRRIKTGEDFSRAAASIAFFIASALKSPQQSTRTTKKRAF